MNRLPWKVQLHETYQQYQQLWKHEKTNTETHIGFQWITVTLHIDNFNVNFHFLHTVKHRVHMGVCICVDTHTSACRVVGTAFTCWFTDDTPITGLFAGFLVAIFSEDLLPGRFFAWLAYEVLPSAFVLTTVRDGPCRGGNSPWSVIGTASPTSDISCFIRFTSCRRSVTSSASPRTARTSARSSWSSARKADTSQWLASTGGRRLSSVA